MTTTRCKCVPLALLLPALLPAGATTILLGPPAARAITRAQVMTSARAYAGHPWRCAAANLDGGCPAGYRSAYTVGDHLGLPYDWGGYMTLHEFDAQIAAGKAAGSPPATSWPAPPGWTAPASWPSAGTSPRWGHGESPMFPLK